MRETFSPEFLCVEWAILVKNNGSFSTLDSGTASHTEKRGQLLYRLVPPRGPDGLAGSQLMTFFA